MKWKIYKYGEYVRTKTGYIGKVENINDFRPPEARICVDFKVPDLIFMSETDLVKHSKNIIDLIEEGDYVNGYFCRYITDIDTEEEYLCNYDLNEMRWIPLENIDIWESIVTKEQFASIQYRLED